MVLNSLCLFLVKKIKSKKCLKTHSKNFSQEIDHFVFISYSGEDSIVAPAARDMNFLRYKLST